jgi:hypothetical protein
MVLIGVILFFSAGAVLVVSVINDWSFVPKDPACRESVAAPLAASVITAVSDQPVPGR